MPAGSKCLGCLRRALDVELGKSGGLFDLVHFTVLLLRQRAIKPLRPRLHQLCFRDSRRFWNTSRRKLLQSDPLVREQPALPADAAAISGKTSISADAPVARNHNGNRVSAIGRANRTDAFRAA